MNDLFWEHSRHDKVVKDCSTCHSQNRLIMAHKLVNEEGYIVPRVEPYNSHLGRSFENWFRNLDIR